jgi:hypothetical protein
LEQIGVTYFRKRNGPIGAIRSIEVVTASITSFVAANDDVVAVPFTYGDLATAAMMLPILVAVAIAIAVGADFDPNLGELHAGVGVGDRDKSNGRSDREGCDQNELPHGFLLMLMRRANAGWLLSFHNYSNTPHIFRNHDAETTTCSSRHGPTEPTPLQQVPSAAHEMRLHGEKNPQESPAMRRCSIASDFGCQCRAESIRL